jgi:hypothetical protein
VRQIKLVPAHVWNPCIDFKALDSARKDAETGLAWRFGARFEKPLETKADSKERDVGPDSRDQSFADFHFVESTHHLAEVADTWQNDFGGSFEPGGIAHEFVLCADCVESVLNGTEIACAVIEDRDHNRPFVEGN